MNSQTQEHPSIKYFCVHCCDVSNQWNLYFAFETVQDVHSHWLSNHTQLAVSKPFLFYALEIMGCHYCTYSGLFGRLCNHHANNHPTEPLVITRRSNREQCALCHYIGPDVVNHFMQTHELVLKTNIFNPVCFTRNTLAELLSIDIHKRRQCGHCGLIFETDSEAQQHHGYMHQDKETQLIEQSDEKPNQISYLICGLCKRPINPEDFYAHVEMDQSIFQFTADRIPQDPTQNYATNYYCNLYQDYLKTKVVFRNGLILFKQNLILSEYDDVQYFSRLVNRIVGNVQF